MLLKIISHFREEKGVNAWMWLSCSKMFLKHFWTLVSSLGVSSFHVTVDSASRLRQTENANLYQVTKFSFYLSFTVHYFNTQISSFTQFFIHKNCFELFLSAHSSILRNSQLESDVCCLLKLSNFTLYTSFGMQALSEKIADKTRRQ